MESHRLTVESDLFREDLNFNTVQRMFDVDDLPNDLVVSKLFSELAPQTWAQMGSEI